MDFGGFVRRTKFLPPISLRPASLLLLAAFFSVAASTVRAASPRVVATSTDLFAALVDASVTHIQLANSITISDSKGPGSWPLLLGRDCLVDATPGSPYPRLDLIHATNDWVRLGPGVTLTFRGLVLSNVFSRSQLSLDFFAQSPASSAIVWEGVVDRRSICKPLQEIRDAWSNAPRPTDGSGSQQQPQQLQQQLAIVDGPNCNADQGCYSMPVLRSYDVLVDSPAGYRIRLNNTLTVCDQFISQDCIQNLGSDICYLNAIEELMAKLSGGGPGSASPSSSSGGGGLSSGAKAGVIAGCVVGGVALLLLLCALPLCRRWRRSGRLTAERQHHDTGGAGGGGGGAAAVAFTVLDPISEAGGLAALGSSRGSTDAKASATTTTTTTVQQPPPLPPPKLPQQQPHHHHLNVVKLLPQGGKAAVQGSPGGGGGADGRPSPDTATDSTDARPSSGPAPGPAALSAALESAGASGVGTVASGQHTHTPTQSLGSAMMAVLRSVLSRPGSRADLHGNDHTASTTAAAAAVAAAAGLAAQGSAAGSLRGALSPMSGTLGSARDSSGGQIALRTGSGRPSMGEIQQELERMEEQWSREHVRAGGGRGAHGPSSAPAPRGGRSPRGGGGGGGGGGGAASAAGGGAGGGGGGRAQPPSRRQQQ